jgi:thioredoxin-dependent peroxiredoxin
MLKPVSQPFAQTIVRVSIVHNFKFNDDMNTGVFQSFLSFMSNTDTADLHFLKVGDPAPDFNTTNQHGELVRLKDFKGKKLALFFYPADNTPTCTKEACNLRDGYAELKKQGVAVLGISPDSEARHQGFIKKHQLPYDLLADENLEMMKAYGVWGHKKFMGREFDGVHRTTFVIDEKGIIRHIFTKVDSGNHTLQILSALSAVAAN